MKQKFKRVYHHYTKCEEYQSTMWKDIDSKQKHLLMNLSIDLLSNPDRFYDTCLEIIKNWIYSCEANFTAPTINSQAWLGAAACAINHGANEEVTKLAWRQLTQDQQLEANLIADKVINLWSTNYAKN